MRPERQRETVTPGSPRRPAASPHATRLRLAGALLLIALILAALALDRLPAWLALGYAGAGLVSFGAYGLDKLAAIRGGWRTSEAMLHLVDLIGGIVGGLTAQAVFRHKIAKPAFARVTGLIAALHAAGLAALMLDINLY